MVQNGGSSGTHAMPICRITVTALLLSTRSSHLRHDQSSLFTIPGAHGVAIHHPSPASATERQVWPASLETRHLSTHKRHACEHPDEANQHAHHNRRNVACTDLITAGERAGATPSQPLWPLNRSLCGPVPHRAGERAPAASNQPNPQCWSTGQRGSVLHNMGPEDSASPFGTSATVHSTMVKLSELHKQLETDKAAPNAKHVPGRPKQ